MRLCCLHDGFNGTVGLSFSQVLLESVSEDGQLPVGLEAAEGLLRFHHARSGSDEPSRNARKQVFGVLERPQRVNSGRETNLLLAREWNAGPCRFAHVVGASKAVVFGLQLTVEPAFRRPGKGRAGSA